MLILSILDEAEGGAEGKEGHSFLETPLVVHPLLGVGVSIGGSNQSSQHSTLTRASGEGNQPAWPGRDLRVKVNLPTFKGQETKNAVTYHSWQGDVAIFHCSGWDNQHLLSYVIWSLQGFPGDLARSLGEDTTLMDILPDTGWEWWCGDDVSKPWVRSSIPSNKD